MENCKPDMEVKNRNIVTAPVESDVTGDAGGGSRSLVSLGAVQGRTDVVAPRLQVVGDARDLAYVFCSVCTCLRNVCTVLWLLVLLPIIGICSVVS